MYVEAMTFDDLSQQPGFPALLGEYAEECAVDSLPVNLDPARIISAYGPLADCGVLHMFGAFISEEDGVPALIGFLSMIVCPLPKYDYTVAATESFFVAAIHRSTGAGLRLLHAAEACARAAGAVGMLVTAPSGGPLSKVLPRSGYSEKDQVFCRRLSDA